MNFPAVWIPLGLSSLGRVHWRSQSQNWGSRSPRPHAHGTCTMHGGLAPRIWSGWNANSKKTPARLSNNVMSCVFQPALSFVIVTSVIDFSCIFSIPSALSWSIFSKRCYHVVHNNFVFQQDSAPVNLAFNIVQLLQCKTLNFLSPELWPHSSPELNVISPGSAEPLLLGEVGNKVACDCVLS